MKFPKVKTTFEMVWAEHICIESASLNFCREEADDHLETLRDALDIGDGDIIEIDGEDADLECAE
ncbi:hypothetical protein [Halorubrum sp. PV6]|uniref:hypothetical protein n=1 Tax=Halorubrum sp. PV6 TaxID=634157 RepID=UPI0011986923|nr:hypothetical protein [Halorubrum sp. PV6]AZQ16154.1 hypothetical protein DOS48_14975 [Halorubrum sp. PV6]